LHAKKLLLNTALLLLFYGRHVHRLLSAAAANLICALTQGRTVCQPQPAAAGRSPAGSAEGCWGPTLHLPVSAEGATPRPWRSLLPGLWGVQDQVQVLTRTQLQKCWHRLGFSA
jgi:hypothetical protein